MQSSPAETAKRRAKRRASLRKTGPRGGYNEGVDASGHTMAAASSGKRKLAESRNVLVNEQVYTYERYRRRRRKKVYKRDTLDAASVEDSDNQKKIVVSETGHVGTEKDEHLQQLQR